MHENSTPHEILRWAGETFGDDLVVTASFGDAVLTHLANSVLPGVDIVLLDTGYLFAETEWYADDLRRRFGLNLRTVHPLPDVERDVWQTDTDACCAARKVEPLQRALAGKRGWVTGVRRADSPSRASTPVVFDDLLRAVTKINPIAKWTDADVATYTAMHELPAHPLTDRGYPSIGCWPCTRPADADDPRAGRWAGTAKTECGLHVSAAPVLVDERTY
ncbi:MAG TPA: phosphoadenylyl-sulfate reductase [Ilumatobacteraceae bacterium]|nr:phosphoadenylyl-sulfate reductase [Ilumatobacteraceae bacterium]